MVMRALRWKRKFRAVKLSKPTKTLFYGVFCRGNLVVKCRNEASAIDFIERQTAEDREWRRRQVLEYLAERAQRAVVVDTEQAPDQLELF